MKNKTIEQLEQELIDMKAMHASQWQTWGSELCAADLYREEEKLEKEIKKLKTIKKWEDSGLLDDIDGNVKDDTFQFFMPSLHQTIINIDPPKRIIFKVVGY
jgi:hypothetical protein